jgi:hypothetical protein
MPVVAQSTAGRKSYLDSFHSNVTVQHNLVACFVRRMRTKQQHDFGECAQWQWQQQRVARLVAAE